MAFTHIPRPSALKSLADVKLAPYWLDSALEPEPAPALEKHIQADLCIVGAGFTGLWTALLSRERYPGQQVVLLEAGSAGMGASGRNGGFVSASITHGFENGLGRWPKEMRHLVKLGQQNLDGIEAAIQKYQIDCDWVRSGELTVAIDSHQVDELRHAADQGREYGENCRFLDQAETCALVNSPLFKAGLLDNDCGMVDPARLVWGLRRACIEQGVNIYENTPVQKLEERKDAVLVTTPAGSVLARKVALATNAYPPLLGKLRRKIVPVYDYVLITEPLTPAQRDSIGWRGRQGVGDSANQFHYSQMTGDGRILWGGYDAVYYPNNGFGPQFDYRRETFERLAEHFLQVFPQLEGIRFTHAWGGAIDTCSRFSAFWGLEHGGKTAYALGYTGLGVGASRFGAQVMLDLLNREDTERTRLEMVRTQPMSFPPEPLRGPVIAFTQWSLAQADQHQGRRNLWLKLLDAMGLGFNS